MSNVGCGVQPVLLAAAKFIAHLVNQQVAHEILALELLTILLDKPTDDSVEVSCDHFYCDRPNLCILRSLGIHRFYRALFLSTEISC